MIILNYSIDFSEALQDINTKKYDRVLLQLPEGLKMKAASILDELKQKTKATIILAGDPCYGACDIPCVTSVQQLSIDAIIQVGHTKIPSMNIPKALQVYFVNAQSNHIVDVVVKKSFACLDGKKIGVLTTAQHLHMLPQVCTLLKENGFQPIISPGDSRISDKGQILGCNFSSAENIKDCVDSFLFIGSGVFHPIGIHLATQKPVIIADPYTQQVKKQELKTIIHTILKQRSAAIALAKQSQVFGILIGLKPGQQRMHTATELKKLLEKHQRKPLFITAEIITPQALQSFSEIDCFVSTACPRIAIDDYILYEKPIITPVELQIAFNETTWESYLFDTFY